MFLDSNFFFLVYLNLLIYRDKQKEASRQNKLKVYQETGAWPGMPAKPKKEEDKSWSLKVAKKQRKEERKTIKNLKRLAKNEAIENSGDDDEDEFESDYKLLKKQKRRRKGQVRVII